MQRFGCILIGILSLFSCQKSSQVEDTFEESDEYEVVFQRFFGGSENDVFNGLSAESDGSVFLVGFGNSMDGDLNGAIDHTSSWTIKTNANGAKLRSNTYLGSDFHGAIPTKDGGSLALQGFRLQGTTLYGIADGLVTKFDVNGSVVWNKSFGGPARDYYNAGIATPDGGTILVGASESKSINGQVSATHDSGDGWVMKIDEKGNLVWSRVFGGPGWEEFFAITRTSDNNYVVVGQASIGGGDVMGHHGNLGEDGWMVKIDDSGNLIWSKALGGTNSDFLRTVVATRDGGVLAAGHTSSYDGDIPPYYNDPMNGWVVKVDATGNKATHHVYGGSDGDAFTGGVNTSDGAVLLVGYSGSNDRDAAGPHPLHYYNAFVVKVDENGSKIASQVVGGDNVTSDVAAAIVAGGKGRYYVCGSSPANNSGFGMDGWLFCLQSK